MRCGKTFDSNILTWFSVSRDPDRGENDYDISVY